MGRIALWYVPPLNRSQVLTRVAYYIKSAGFGNLAILVACTASYSFFSTFLQYWLKWWTTDSGNTALYISGYMLFAFAAWISTTAQMWLVFAVLSGVFMLTCAGPRSCCLRRDLAACCTRHSSSASLGTMSGQSAWSTANEIGHHFLTLCRQIRGLHSIGKSLYVLGLLL